MPKTNQAWIPERSATRLSNVVLPKGKVCCTKRATHHKDASETR
jgi:hypothetical protein